MADVEWCFSVQLLLQPIVTSNEFFDEAVPQRRIAQRLGSAHDFPTERTTGTAKPLCDRLNSQRLPSSLPCLWYQPAPIMQRILICADDVGVKDGRQSGS